MVAGSLSSSAKRVCVVGYGSGVTTHAVLTHPIEKALTIFAPSKLFIDPDCGLKTRSVEEAKAKLKNMTAATQSVRKSHGWT